jgi:hypothetical protein
MAVEDRDTDDELNQEPAFQELFEFLQAHPPDDDPGAYLVGAITIVEWMSPDGDRFLRFLTDPDASWWQVFGYLRDAQLWYENDRVRSHDLDD